MFSSAEKPKNTQEEKNAVAFNLESLKFEYDRHRISTAYALVSLLLLFLKNFKKNCKILIFVDFIKFYLRFFPIFIFNSTYHRCPWIPGFIEIYDGKIQ